MPRAMKDPGERFWSKAAMSAGCRIWMGSYTNSGYGQFLLHGRMRLAHRVAYELAFGPIPDGLTIDHLCGVKGCVRPEHLEAVTQAENSRRSDNASGRNARKAACPQGHPYDDSNTYLVPKTGWRQCRACAAERRRARNAE